MEINRVKRYRIINRQRFSLFIFFIIVIPVCIILIFFNNKTYSARYSSIYREVLVQEGDTLWNIAGKYKSDNYDIRKMVFNIQKINQMKDVEIYPGDLLKIPIRY